MTAHIVKLVLTGAKTGQTVTLGKHSFVNGVAEIQASYEAMNAVLTYMGRAYQAYPQGSDLLAATQDRDRADGLLRDLQTDSPSPDRAPAPVQGVGDHAAGSIPGPRALHGSGDDGHQAGGSGLVSGGSGHTDSGLGKGMEPGAQQQSDAVIRSVRAIVGQMNPHVAEQWTDDGLPSVAYVAESTGTPSITREAIEIACPGWNRNKAEDLLASQ